MTDRRQRQALPLLLACQHAAGDDERFPLDRVRLQKAVFLVTQGAADWADAYQYRPYNWGPFSSDLTHDTDALVAAGRLRVAPGSRYGRYVTTDAGEAEAEQLWKSLGPAQRRFLADVRRFVTGRSFDRLLRDVYAAYPDFATKSLFRG